MGMKSYMVNMNLDVNANNMNGVCKITPEVLTHAFFACVMHIKKNEEGTAASLLMEDAPTLLGANYSAFFAHMALKGFKDSLEELSERLTSSKDMEDEDE